MWLTTQVATITWPDHAVVHNNHILFSFSDKLEDLFELCASTGGNKFSKNQYYTCANTILHRMDNFETIDANGMYCDIDLK